MLVDDVRAGVEPVGHEPHRDEDGLVAEPAGIEYGADLAHHILLLHPCDAGDHLVAADI